MRNVNLLPKIEKLEKTFSELTSRLSRNANFIEIRLEDIEMRYHIYRFHGWHIWQNNS